MARNGSAKLQHGRRTSGSVIWDRGCEEGLIAPPIASSRMSRVGVRGRWSPVASFAFPPSRVSRLLCKLRERAEGHEAPIKTEPLKRNPRRRTHERRARRSRVLDYLLASRDGDGWSRCFRSRAMLCRNDRDKLEKDLAAKNPRTLICGQRISLDGK